MVNSVFCACRLGAGPDVQRLVGAGEPPPGCRLQAPAGGQLRHLPEPQQKAETVAAQNGHRYGETPLYLG